MNFTEFYITANVVMAIQIGPKRSYFILRLVTYEILIRFGIVFGTIQYHSVTYLNRR